ncbi:MAG: TfoX/Sxy family protein [Hyphomicrobiales bacterium]
MVERYRAELQDIVGRFEDREHPSTGIECRHFFSGAAAYADGRIFMSLSPAGLALKLPEAVRDTLLAEGACALRYFPKAPVKKDYVVLPDSLAGDDAALHALIAKAISYSLEDGGSSDDRGA